MALRGSGSQGGPWSEQPHGLSPSWPCHALTPPLGVGRAWCGRAWLGLGHGSFVSGGAGSGLPACPPAYPSATYANNVLSQASSSSSRFDFDLHARAHTHDSSSAWAHPESGPLYMAPGCLPGWGARCVPCLASCGVRGPRPDMIAEGAWVLVMWSMHRISGSVVRLI